MEAKERNVKVEVGFEEGANGYAVKMAFHQVSRVEFAKAGEAATLMPGGLVLNPGSLRYALLTAENEQPQLSSSLEVGTCRAEWLA